MVPFLGVEIANLTPGPALIVRRDGSSVPVSFMVPITVQAADCVFFALVPKLINGTHSCFENAIEMRFVPAMPSRAILLPSSVYVATSSSDCPTMNLSLALGGPGGRPSRQQANAQCEHRNAHRHSCRAS